MAIIKCKMCGGDMEIAPDKTFGTCEYCGTAMTMPRVDDEQRAAAFNRGNHFRRIGEFDKALAVYERIVQEDNTDAEAHWCCALCRFGIEYVEDPTTYEWLPTCHRASFDSFLEDVDFKAALEHSDGITRRQYQRDAAKIAEVQRGILATSQNTEPFDVFICYKESDAEGNRTRDSLLAQDIYYQLTEQGRRVFFARITLEDIAGTQYEPYIFAALNSARVMVVVGTKPEHLNAVWVKNEWSRFLAMMKKDHSKLLLPCFRDMDPYDLPEQLSVLQSYDMSKIGFIQDLTRGIAKVLDAEKKPVQKETVIVQQRSDAVNVAPLLKRAFMFLEDGNWTEADAYCERVLDQDPENARAYAAKLMAELRVRRHQELPNCAEPFDNRPNYQKAVRYADEKLAAMLKGYSAHIKKRNKETWLNNTYSEACRIMSSASTEESFLKAATRFEEIPDYKDSAEKAEDCRSKAENVRKDSIYATGSKCMAEGTTLKLGQAISCFQQIPNWKDSKEKIAACQRRIKELVAKQKDEKYNAACAYMTKGTVAGYEEAIKQFQYFDTLPEGWRDHRANIAECQRKIAEIKRIEAQKAEAARRTAKRNTILAVIVFVLIAAAVLTYIYLLTPIKQYNKAEKLLAAGEYLDAYNIYTTLGTYKDSSAKLEQLAEQHPILTKNPGDILSFGNYEQDNKTANGKEAIEWLVLDREADRILVISRYALDCQSYNPSYVSTTWSSCTLRTWLNSAFLNAAFSEEERAMIPAVTISNPDNPEYGTDGGASTTDRIFLLSIEEAEKYFSSDSKRDTEATAYAKAKGADIDDNGTIWWWLRSPGNSSNCAASVYSSGGIHYYGNGVHGYGSGVDYCVVAVRPAMWIDLSSPK